jgi:hypothetical protein
VARKRHTIESREGKWFSTGKKGAPVKKGLRDHIGSVLVPGKALGSNDIFEAVRKVAPRVKKGTVDCALTRQAGNGRWPEYSLRNGDPLS